MTPYGRSDFASDFDVSRETMERFDAYVSLLERWAARINLVSRASLAHVWRRHMADSAQLADLVPPAATWLDFGSGAGFPGLVLAALRPGCRFILVDSDARKCAFLSEAARAMQIPAVIRNSRVEALDPLDADVVSARAVAPLAELLPTYEMHRSSAGIGLFPKGETVHKELEAAAGSWRFEYSVHPSRTEPRALIIRVGAVSRA